MNAKNLAIILSFTISPIAQAGKSSQALPSSGSQSQLVTPVSSGASAVMRNRIKREGSSLYRRLFRFPRRRALRGKSDFTSDIDSSSGSFSSLLNHPLEAYLEGPNAEEAILFLGFYFLEIREVKRFVIQWLHDENRSVESRGTLMMRLNWRQDIVDEADFLSRLEMISLNPGDPLATYAGELFEQRRASQLHRDCLIQKVRALHPGCSSQELASSGLYDLMRMHYADPKVVDLVAEVIENQVLTAEDRTELMEYLKAWHKEEDLKKIAEFDSDPEVRALAEYYLRDQVETPNFLTEHFFLGHSKGPKYYATPCPSLFSTHLLLDDPEFKNIVHRLYEKAPNPEIQKRVATILSAYAGIEHF